MNLNEKKPQKCKYCNKEISYTINILNKKISLCEDHQKVFEDALNLSNLQYAHNSFKSNGEELEIENKAKYLKQYTSLLDFNMKPKEIYNELSKYVVGQEDAKRKLSVAIRRHYARLKFKILDLENKKTPNIPKENILLIGPTGSGKTFTCRNISNIISVPFWTASMSGFTEDGYVGDSVESLMSSLLRESGYFTQLAECGMLFLDEIDKKAMKTAGNPSITRDVSGEGVQAALLDMIDTNGSIMNVGLNMGSRKHSQRYTERMNTKDILFVLGGAFSGLSDIIRKRTTSGKKIGFGVNNCELNAVDKQKEENELLHNVLHEDIIEYGFLPELVGRIGTIAVLDPLSENDLKNILLNVENSVIKQQKILASIEDLELDFTEEAINSIIKKAISSGMGARRLKGIVSEATERIFFDLSGEKSGKKVRILEETIEDNSKYEIVA